jgi:hypothetical protein
MVTHMREVPLAEVDRDHESPTRDRERLIDARSAAVGDHDPRSVASDHPPDDRRRQGLATSRSIAAHNETHV